MTENDVSTVQEPDLADVPSVQTVPEPSTQTAPEPDTPEQIEDYCEKLERMAPSEDLYYGQMMVKTVQIIKQLQAELQDRPVHIDDLSAPVLASPTGPPGQL